METQNLTKNFRGARPDEQRTWSDALVDGIRHLIHPPERKSVVDRVSLSIEQGEFFGIIGSNGAGKTTLLKLVCSLLYPDGGEGRVNGYDLRRQRTDVRRSIALARAGGWI